MPSRHKGLDPVIVLAMPALRKQSQEHPKIKVILRESKFEVSLSYVNPCAKRREPEEAISS